MKVSAHFTAPTADALARLFVTASLDPGWHLYSITQAAGGPVPTRIKLDKTKAFSLAGPLMADPAPDKKAEPVFNNLIVETHSGTVTWSAPIEFASGADPTTVKISGSVYAQLCDPGACLPPKDYSFTALFQPGKPAEQPAQTAKSQTVESPTVAAPVPPAPRGASFNADELHANSQKQDEGVSLAWEAVLGFLGGILLNFMPCVLPVIGLKILSFIEQSAHDRRTALMLNVWYSAGLIAVFLLLAALATSLHRGWGLLFQETGFNIFMIVVLFAMGLSFLGVWEFPIPGFAGAGRAQQMARREGFAGAFSKGVITTLLATPCIGPLMGGAVAWALNQPPVKTYAVFSSIGLGMASPYLLIGAFPGLVRFLPKPGAWMETFKNIMGFVLLASVVFIFTFLDWSYVVPTIGLVFAVWAACWWIGRIAMTAEWGSKLRGWGGATAFVGLMWIVLFPGIDSIAPEGIPLRFHGLQKEMQERLDRMLAAAGTTGEPVPAARGRFDNVRAAADGRWRPFQSRSQLADAVNAGKTVLIDFTADWCFNCKTLEAQVLDTKDVYEVLDKNSVMTLRADWTRNDPKVTEMLELLNAKQVPVIAIFSATDPNKPIVFKNGYTKAMLLDALAKAGPSRT